MKRAQGFAWEFRYYVMEGSVRKPKVQTFDSAIYKTEKAPSFPEPKNSVFHLAKFKYFTTTEEAAYLVAKHEGIALLNRTRAWRVARNGLTMRPLDEPGIVVKTTLITRSDDRTRLTSEYVRSAKRKLERKSNADQQRLPLAI